MLHRLESSSAAVDNAGITRPTSRMRDPPLAIPLFAIGRFSSRRMGCGWRRNAGYLLDDRQGAVVTNSRQHGHERRTTTTPCRRPGFCPDPTPQCPDSAYT